MKRLLTGDEAIARGAWEAGVIHASAYPGTPSTEILENIAKYEEIVKTMGGAVVSTDKWGTKKTAYPINYKNEAYYVLMTFEADGKIVEELKRIALIDANVVRRLITKLN